MAHHYRYDVFVNYAREDNTADHPLGAFWVDTFQRFLRAVLEEMLDRDPIIYDGHPAPMAAEDTMACLHLISEHFWQDEDCQLSIERFGANKGKAGRNFVIIRKPLDEALGADLSDRLPYHFYDLHERTGQILQFEEFNTGEVTDNSKFWLALLDLCYDLVSHISTLEGKANPVSRNASVFLAHSGFDVEDERLLVKRELIRYGYKVLPNRPLPSDQKAVEAAIQDALSKSEYAISLVGDDLGPKPQGLNEHLPVLENQIAIAYEADVNLRNKEDRTFKRLIWLKPNIEIRSEAQQQFINSVKRDANNRDEVELVQSRIEDFKSILISNLAIKLSDIMQYDDTNTTTRSEKIYLMADMRDQEGYNELKDWLKNEGYHFLFLDPDSTSGERQAQHRRHLEHCDFAMVYFNKAKKTWLNTKLQDIIKAPGFGRAKPIERTIIVAGQEVNEETMLMLMDLIPKFDAMHLLDASTGISRIHAYLKDALS